MSPPLSLYCGHCHQSTHTRCSSACHPSINFMTVGFCQQERLRPLALKECHSQTDGEGFLATNPGTCTSLMCVQSEANVTGPFTQPASKQLPDLRTAAPCIHRSFAPNNTPLHWLAGQALEAGYSPVCALHRTVVLYCDLIASDRHSCLCALLRPTRLPCLTIRAVACSSSAGIRIESLLLLAHDACCWGCCGVPLLHLHHACHVAVLLRGASGLQQQKAKRR
jgi:hypothetical protein